MTRTIVAVDFDGVVNALPRSPRDLAHFERWDRQEVLGFPLTVAGELLAWLRTLEQRGGEFHWATTWTPMRHLLDEAFGLPSRAPVAADPDAPARRAPRGVSWKGTQIAELVERTQRPLVWLDDDAVTEPTAAMLGDLADRLSLPMLAVCTTPSSGLVPRQMERVDQFLADVQSGAATTGLEVIH